MTKKLRVLNDVVNKHLIKTRRAEENVHWPRFIVLNSKNPSEITDLVYEAMEEYATMREKEAYYAGQNNGMFAMTGTKECKTFENWKNEKD